MTALPTPKQFAGGTFFGPIGLLLIALLTAAPVEAQQGDVVTGLITDAETGEPIAGALVNLEEAERATLTGPDGTFALTGVRPGETAVTVEMLGFAPYSGNWEIVRGARLEVALEPAAIELEGVVVDIETIEDLFTQRRAASGTAVQRVGPEELEASSWTTLREFLRGRIGITLCPQFGMAANRAAGSMSEWLSNAAAGFPACVMTRGRPTPIAVFVDELYSSAGINALDVYHPREIYSIEIARGGSEIRVFTHRLIHRTQRGRATLLRNRPVPAPGGPGG